MIYAKAKSECNHHPFTFATNMHLQDSFRDQESGNTARAGNCTKPALQNIEKKSTKNNML